MSSGDESLTSKVRMRRDLTELREAFVSQQSKFKQQLAQCQSAHSELCEAYKTLAFNFGEHLAQSQLAQSKYATKLANLTIKLKSYKIQALEGRLFDKKRNYNPKKTTTTSSSDESADSAEDGVKNISVAAPVKITDRMPESDQGFSQQKRSCELHQRTGNVLANGDDTIGDNVPIVRSNSTAAKKKKTTAQETDANDTETSSTSEVSKHISESSDSTDTISHKRKRNASYSTSIVEIEETGHADQMSENAWDPTPHSLRSTANEDHIRQERAQESSSRRHHYSYGEDESTSASLQTFPGSVCQKAVPSSANLQMHRENYLNENMVEPSHSKLQGRGQHLMEEEEFVDYLCKICSRSFNTGHSLQMHLLIHPGCGLCPETFINPSHLNRHFGIAHKNSKFHIVCRFCGKLFWGTSTWFLHKQKSRCRSRVRKYQPVGLVGETRSE